MAESRILELILTLKDQASKELVKVSGFFSKNASAIRTAGAVLDSAGVAILLLGNNSTKAAADIETQRIGFKTLLGSVEEADKAINMIQKDAASTPFEFSGLIEANKSLTFVTKNAEASEKVLLNVGKALAVSGKGQEALNNVIYNLQQIGNTGKITEMDIRQFGMNGINILELLADYYGTTKERAGEMVKDSKDAFADLSGALEKAGSDGGKFANAFSDAAGSFNQMSSNAKDSINILFSALGENLLPIFKRVLENVIPLINKMTELINAHPELAKAIAILMVIFGPLLVVFGTLLLLLPTITTSLGILGAAFTAINIPFLLIIATIGIIIATGYLLIKNWDTIKWAAGLLRDWVVDKFNAIKNAWSNMWEAVGTMATNAWEGIKNTIKSSINWIIDKINFFIRKSNDVVAIGNKVPGVNIPTIPEIPKLANGGIVRKPTLAMIGEAGPEAVVPLSRGNGGFGNIVINVYGDVSGEELVNKVKSTLMDQLRLNTKLAL